MPIDKHTFEGGVAPKRKKLQINIVKILQKNPQVAISSIEFENILNTRRQAINQALRSLEGKRIIERGYVKDGSRHVTYVRIKEKYIDKDISHLL